MAIGHTSLDIFKGRISSPPGTKTIGLWVVYEIFLSHGINAVVIWRVSTMLAAFQYSVWKEG